MISIFLNDKTKFKKKIVLYISITIFFFIMDALLYSFYMNINQDNMNKSNLYNMQAEWLKNYDNNAANNLEKVILKPIKETDLENTEKEQIELFNRNNINIISIDKKGRTTKNKLKFLSTVAVFEGNWDDIKNLLNEFETYHLVIIKELDISSESKNLIKCQMAYDIYYI